MRELGHKVTLEQQWSGSHAHCMIALHARRSHASIHAYATAFPDQPLVVALTGTDLYRDIHTDADAKASLALATRFIVLQELGAKALPPRLRGKVVTIYQSATAVSVQPLRSCFEFVVSGHLREEKDPFRAAAALSLLPATSGVRVTHLGRALTREMDREARQWMNREPRYRWLGELPRARAQRVLGRSRALVMSSRMEGGANVVSEALACGVPVIASRVPGNVGMLGAHYRGYFPVGDERALARLLARAERDAAFLTNLRQSCAARASLVAPARERAALQQLLASCFRQRARAKAAV